MNMTLKELMDWLAEIQKIAGDATVTNVTAIRLEGATTFDYSDRYNYGYGREGKRARHLTVLFDVSQITEATDVRSEALT